MNFEKEIEQLNKNLEGLENSELIEKQHQKGKMAARERIAALIDPETFVEFDPFAETRFSRFGLDKKESRGRRGDRRFWQNQQPAGLRLQPGFYQGGRRFVGRNARQKNY
jgi:Acetyl-CoA carboxylase, carboxyltransferase component (subunits alpha and beta)